ncbi:MAG: carbohydrate-binding domain-containing protein, partial [Lachnospiraceae bacterium]|nr:carbohydrate-binding domain-containing protein [Lachnospiraceae bacterium]
VNALVIRDGDVEIDASEEGMESRYILINDGEVRILAGDDGINISDGSGSKAAVPGDGSLIINGGTVTVDSQGDGIDSNGNVQINGGYTIVSGTMTGGNAALDYDGDCEINGGVLLLTSFGDMETGVGAASKQRMASITLSEALAAGTSIEISDKDGEVLYTFRNAKQCRYIAVCSPEVTEESVIHITAAGQIQTAVVR